MVSVYSDVFSWTFTKNVIGSFVITLQILKITIQDKVVTELANEEMRIDPEEQNSISFSEGTV